MSELESTPAPLSTSDPRQEEMSRDGGNAGLNTADYALLEKRGFDLLQDAYIPGVASRVLVLRHRSTLATIISLHNEDPHKWFQIGFQTLPSDSTGVFHKLEHALLSGSPNVKVREPFDEMTRSLALSEANASTWSDLTTYYLGSTDEKTLYLGARIFFDAALRGNLSEDVYKREHGYLRPIPLSANEEVWRFGGIVHDEMRGYYADPVRWIDQNFSRALLPGSPYAHDAGGNPAEMPKLTYRDFLETYRRFYDPSNMVCVLYGDHSLASRLEFLDEHLKDVKGRGTIIDAPKPLVFDSPREQTASYPFPSADQTVLQQQIYFQIGWKFPHVVDHQEKLELSLLRTLLSTTEFSPFTQAHRRSGIENIHSETTFIRRGPEDCFVFSFSEGNFESAQQSKEFTLAVLSDLAKYGFKEELINTVLNQEEYSFRQALQNSLRAKGISQAFLKNGLHKDFDYDKVPVIERLQSIRQKLAAGERVFEALIEKYLLNNNDRLCLTHLPDPNIFREWNKAQSAWVQRQVEKMGHSGLARQRKEAQRLTKLEDALDSVAGLKTVPISALPTKVRTEDPIPVRVEKFSDINITHQPQDTKGIAKVTCSFEIQGLPPEKVSLLHFVGRVLASRGAMEFAPGEYVAKVGRETGGINFGLDLYPQFGSPSAANAEPKVVFTISGEATPGHYQDLLDLMLTPVLRPGFEDRQYLRFLVNKTLASLKLDQFKPTTTRGLVASRLERHTSVLGEWSWQNRVERALQSYEELSYRVENDWENLHSELEGLRQVMLSAHAATISATVDDTSWKDLKPSIANLAEKLSQHRVRSPALPTSLEFAGDSRAHAFPRPLANNYVGQTVALLNSDGTRFTEHGKAEILCALINRNLNREIRLKGSAYGASASYSCYTSALTFTSWQDPNIAATFEAFASCPDFLRNEVTADFLERARVETISSYERPTSPIARGQTGLSRLFIGMKDSDVTLMRGQIMDTSLQDVKAFADLLEDAFARENAKVVYGNPEHIQAAIDAGLEFVVHRPSGFDS